MQAMTMLLNGILEQECRTSERSLVVLHKSSSQSGPWEPTVILHKRGCRSTVTDNATATWEKTADADTNFCSHEQSSIGYGLCLAVSSSGTPLEVVTTTTAESIAAHLEGKATETAKLVSAGFQELVGRHIAIFMVSLSRQPFHGS
jgi:hypothetical protein